MRNTKVLVVAALSLTLASCGVDPGLAPASDVIAMKRSGANDAALLKWVQSPSRTFDLDETDIADLVEAGLSEEVLDAMLARSKEHHEGGRSHEHERQHHH